MLEYFIKNRVFLFWKIQWLLNYKVKTPENYKKNRIYKSLQKFINLCIMSTKINKQISKGLNFRKLRTKSK